MRRILHVENDPLVARAVARLLQARGYAVRTASSHAEGASLLRQSIADGHAAPHFDIGLFDIDLGDGDGVELAGRMQRLEMVDHVLFFTARTDSVTRGRASALGLVISKTSDVDQIFQALARCESRSAGSATRRAVGADSVPPSATEIVAADPLRRAGQRTA